MYSIIYTVLYVQIMNCTQYIYEQFKSFSVAHFKSYEWYWWCINVCVYIGSLVYIFELYQVKAKVGKIFLKPWQ